MKNINNELAQFRGSDNFTNYRNYVITEGIKHLIENYQCYWILDLIHSYQLDESISEQEFQVWTLRRVKDSSFLMNCHDGDYNTITEQEIPFSDFIGDELTIWFTNGTILLPSEY